MEQIGENIGTTPIQVIYDWNHPTNLQQMVDTTIAGISLGIDASKHSNTVISLDAKSILQGYVLEAGTDGVLLSGLNDTSSHLRLLLLTADCAPIAVSSKDGNTMGLIHAGWQGIAGDIIGNFHTLLEVQKLKKQDTYFKIGPMAGDNFEFQEADIHTHFSPLMQKYQLDISNYISHKNVRYMLNLRNIIRDVLLSLGYEDTNIEFDPQETNNPKNTLPSHRLYTLTKKLLLQTQTKEFQKKIPGEIIEKMPLFATHFTLIQRSFLSPYLDATQEEKDFFKSEIFEYYLQSKRMTTIVFN